MSGAKKKRISHMPRISSMRGMFGFTRPVREECRHNSEILCAVGSGEQANFSRAFKIQLMHSPSKYQEFCKA